MNNRFTISNFKVFNSEGVSFDLKPVSLITGQNSSGKSTLTKSIVLLWDFFKQARQQIFTEGRFDPASCKLNFAIPELKLGGFNIEKNRNSPSDEICFSYTCRPKSAMFFDFTVEYGFRAKNEDVLNNGWLSHIEVTARYKDEEYKIFRVEVSDGKTDVVYLSLDNTIFYHSFDAAFFFFNYFRLNDRIDECSACADPDEEKYYSSLVETRKSLAKLNVSFSSEQKKGLEQVYNHIFDEDSFSSYPELFNPELVDAITQLKEDCLLFYFPVLERLRNISKEEAIDIIENSEKAIVQNPYGLYVPRSDIKTIVEDFRNSSYESFIDYYRDIENNRLENLTPELDYDSSSHTSDLFSKVLMKSLVCYSSLTEWEDRSYFMTVYRFLCNWQYSEPEETYEKFIKVVSSSENIYIRHHLYSAFQQYLKILLQELLLPESFDDVRYIGGVVNEVKRQYTLYDNKDSFIRTIERYLNSKREYLQAAKEVESYYSNVTVDFQPGDFIDKWLKELKIGNKLNIIFNQDTQSIHINISKDEENRRIVSLADEGYGVNHLVTLLVSIESEIINLKRLSMLNRKIPILGGLPPKPYVLPTCTLLIEEPEVGLHPAFQSKLAAMFLEATEMFANGNLQFVIETHSEYLIRATQVYVAQQNYDEVTLKKDCPFIVNYVPLNGLPYDLEYTTSGRFVKKFGEGFFDMTSSLNYELYRLEHNKQ